jgi:hypothetical protein
MEARCPRSLARGRSHCAPEQAMGGRCQAPVGGPLETRGGGRVLGSASPITRLSQPVSLLSRLRDWLDPAADAKISFGWSREADWLRGGLVAVSGSDYHGLSSTPAGLKLIDTEALGVRTLEPGASVHRLAEGTFFALGGTRDGKTETETGMECERVLDRGREVLARARRGVGVVARCGRRLRLRPRPGRRPKHRARPRVPSRRRAGGSRPG